jgi:uncharacterized protein YjbI with pentapeptide repeats
LQLFLVYDNTEVEEMKRTIVWMFCLAIIVLLLSTGVQAQALTDVPASDILEQIRNGEDVAYENVRITGKLDLSKIKLETVPNARSARDIEWHGLEKELKIVESNIIIQNSVFEEDVDFSNTEFRKDIVFSGTSFSSKNDFFLGANFAGNVEFSDTNFAGYTNFRDANFAGDANFWDANFAGDADFSYANFASRATFRNASIFRVLTNVNFRDANFASNATFRDANFAGLANFEGANFDGNADFWDANFAGYTIFSDTNFAGNANFGFVNFADYVEFRDANFASRATFDSTEFNKGHFTRATFTTVSLDESEFNQMKVEWSSLKDALVFDGPIYIKLIKHFRGVEQFEDADAAYYQYRRLSQASKKWSYSKLMDVVAGASCGYGVKPARPLIWAFVLIMVFTLVYWRGKGIKRLKENDGDKNRVSRWAAFYNAFYFSVVTFTTVGYGDWYPEDRYRIVVMIEGVLGWLLLALFIVTLANVMIRP